MSASQVRSSGWQAGLWMVAFLIAGILTAAAQTPPPDLQALADQLHRESNAPGVGIVVVADGTIETAVAGERVVDSGVPVEPNDPWHLGSNTKSMTAVLAARLVEAGRISWETTIGESLGKDFPDMQEGYRDASLTHLLRHRSGMPSNINLSKFPEIAGTDAERDAGDDRITYAGWILETPPAAGLDERDLYSNAGFVVAALMLERAAGKPYETMMQEEVFGPLGMADADWGPPGSADGIDAPRGHNLLGVSLPPGPHADNPVAMNSAGRAHMPLADIGAYLRAHLEAARGVPTEYLSKESWKKLHTATPGGQFALGWVALPNGALAHAGSNTLWFSQFLIVPEAGKAIAIVSNSGNIPAQQTGFQNTVRAILLPAE